MKVKELKDLCNKAVKLRWGDREVYVSDDEECNGFHTLNYGLTIDPETLEEIAADYKDTNYDDIVALM